MTSYVLMWERPDGERCWEALEAGQVNEFLKKLINDGVRPATVMVAFSPIVFHWVWKKFHKGLSDVYFSKINAEIYGSEPTDESMHKPVDVPLEQEKDESKLGWISPDGRFLGCEYGGHSNLARRICGDIQQINDPERHLEELGWAKVLCDPCARSQYVIGMGLNKKLTDNQFNTLQRMELDNSHGMEYLL